MNKDIEAELLNTALKGFIALKKDASITLRTRYYTDWTELGEPEESIEWVNKMMPRFKTLRDKEVLEKLQAGYQALLELSENTYVLWAASSSHFWKDKFVEIDDEIAAIEATLDWITEGEKHYG